MQRTQWVGFDLDEVRSAADDEHVGGGFAEPQIALTFYRDFGPYQFVQQDIGGVDV